MPHIVIGQKVKTDLVAQAKQMRRAMTPVEKILWEHLRANRLGGFHFRRQQIIHGYIADFYCHATVLIVEVDGPIHNRQHERDIARDDALREAGFRILRFRNEQVQTDLQYVLDMILKTCENLSPGPSPCRRQE